MTSRGLWTLCDDPARHTDFWKSESVTYPLTNQMLEMFTQRGSWRDSARQSNPHPSLLPTQSFSLPCWPRWAARWSFQPPPPAAKSFTPLPPLSPPGERMPEDKATKQGEVNSISLNTFTTKRFIWVSLPSFCFSQPWLFWKALRFTKIGYKATHTCGRHQIYASVEKKPPLLSKNSKNLTNSPFIL